MRTRDDATMRDLVYHYLLLAECWQFYLQDNRAEPDLEWNEKTGEDLLATSKGAIVVGTLRDEIVSVSVQVLDCTHAIDGEVYLVGGTLDPLDKVAKELS
jgi:hypothetical protein